jgi:ubiquinone/menaquinone biosynthesis C-methylase UbiE
MSQITFNTLKDSAWTFSTLAMLAESGAFPLIEKGACLEELTTASKIPPQILKAALELLCACNFIQEKDNHFYFEGDLKEKIQKSSSLRMASEIKSAFGQMRELIARTHQGTLTAGWTHTDPDILQSQGKYSEIIATDFVPLFPEIPALLKKPKAKFLDIGAGVARIALKMCELYPTITAVALEPADHPFCLAEKNIAQSPYASRMDLRKIGMQELQEENTFDVIWMAQGFILDHHFFPGLSAVYRALKPGGMLLTVEFISKTQKDMATGVMDFMSSLYGTVRTPEEIMQFLAQEKFINVREKVVDGLYSLIVASK